MEPFDFRTLVENSRDTIYLLDSSGTVLYANPAIEDLLGYKREEFTGRNLFDFQTSESRIISEDNFRRRVRGEASPARYMVDFVMKGGGIKHCEIFATIIKGEGGSIFVQAILRDMTAHEELKRGLERERKKVETLVNTSVAVVVGLDLDANITMFNRGAEVATGYSQDEVLGRSMFGLFVPIERRAVFMEGMRRFVEGQTPMKGAWMIQNKSGQPVHLSFDINLVKDEEGKAVGSLAIGQDVTEHVRLERTLKKQNDTLEMLGAVSLATSSSLDAQELLSSGLPILFQFFGFEHASVYLVDGANLKLDRIISVGGENKTVDTGRVLPEEIRKRILSERRPIVVPGIDGERPEAFPPELGSAAFLPLIGNRGVVGILCMCSSRPIAFTPSDLYFFEAGSRIMGYALENSLLHQSLQKTFEHVELYSDILLHDILNYMMPVRAYMGLAVDQKLDQEERGRFLEKAVGAVDRMSIFIDRVRVLLHAIEGRDTNSPVPLGGSLREAIDIAKGRYTGAEIVLDEESKRIAEGISVVAGKALHQIFLNILTNAIKHSAPEPVEVKVRKDAERGTCSVEIADRGPGISDEKKKLIFSKHYAEDTVKAKKGTGIGLAIVETPVRNYGGKVWVEDRVPGDHSKGAKFVVELRLAGEAA